MIWLVLGFAAALFAIVSFFIACDKQEPVLLVIPLGLAICSGLFFYHNYSSWKQSRETADFIYTELLVSETPEGVQYVEVGGEIVNVNEKFGKSFKENETIFVKNYSENTVSGVHTNSYWTLELEKDDED